MRQDIELHINTGDVAIARQNSFKKREFRWVENPSGLSRYVYGEVDLPGMLSEKTIRHGSMTNIGGFYFEVSYTPVYKEMMVRVRRVFDDGSWQYVLNETDGSEWYVVKTGLYGSDGADGTDKPNKANEANTSLLNVYACQLSLLSEEALYGRIEGGVVRLYGCEQSDFNIVDAERQNSNCLLACNPSNNYRYPLSGVGIGRWINSNSVQSGALAERIQNEFSDDGVVVNNAAFDYETQKMSLEVKS